MSDYPKADWESAGGAVRLYRGDCRAILPALPLGFASAAVTDPPYGETTLQWDRWVDGWPGLCLPLLAPSGSLWSFGSMRMFLEEREDFAAYRFVQDIVWEKQNGSGFQADRFKRVHESAAQFIPKGAKWSEIYREVQHTQDAEPRKVVAQRWSQHMGKIGKSSYTTERGGPKMVRSVIPVANCHGHAIHPTQKPLGIVLPLLQYSCPPGGICLDPFFGSGTTAIACLQTGRRFAGIEGDAAMFDKAVSRIEEWLLQPRLFSTEETRPPANQEALAL